MWTYLDVMRDRLGMLDVPILGGLPIAHDRDARTVPLGVSATLDASAKTLSIAGDAGG
jgi:muramoyltetrapeptide carboxypeptidase